MTLSETLKLLLSLGIYLSAAGLVFGMVLENLQVRKLLTNYWVGLTNQVEKPKYLAKRTFEIVKSIFQAIYHQNGKLSHERLAYIAVIVTVLSLLGLLEANRVQSFDSNFIYLIKFIFIIWVIGVYFYEYLGYIVTQYFLKKLIKRKRLSYLGANLVTILGLAYIVPFLFQTVYESLNESIFYYRPLTTQADAAYIASWIWPLGPMHGVLNSNNTLIVRLLFMPAALSICLPVILLITSIVLLRNKHSLGLMAKAIESISALQAEKIKKGSLLSLAIFSALIATL